MRAPKPDDHRAYRELDDIQSGAPLNAFNRPNYLRHPVITTQAARRARPVGLRVSGTRTSSPLWAQVVNVVTR